MSERRNSTGLFFIAVRTNSLFFAFNGTGWSFRNFPVFIFVRNKCLVACSQRATAAALNSISLLAGNLTLNTCFSKVMIQLWYCFSYCFCAVNAFFFSDACALAGCLLYGYKIPVCMGGSRQSFGIGISANEAGFNYFALARAGCIYCDLVVEYMCG